MFELLFHLVLSAVHLEGFLLLIFYFKAVILMHNCGNKTFLQLEAADYHPKAQIIPELWPQIPEEVEETIFQIMRPHRFKEEQNTPKVKNSSRVE